MPKRLRQLAFATATSGIVMWSLAGVWHNIILPNTRTGTHAHHEGLGIALLAYLILAILMCLLHMRMNRRGRPLLDGLELGVVVGVLWVFPHGLAIAAIHDTSLLYELKNALWHVVEQGAGGVVIAWWYRN